MDTSSMAAAAAWDEEYRRAGIPSSHREAPSGVVRWALANLPFLGIIEGGVAIDVGCGKGRNTRALANAGFGATGLDYSSQAIEFARSVPSQSATFLLADATSRLPFEDQSIDLVLDIFVYFHNLNDSTRLTYRRELARIMKPNSALVMSLATEGDGYYSECPSVESPLVQSAIPIKWDPVANVGNILPNADQFFEEMGDTFEPEMTWFKRKPGQMHGTTHCRETLAGIFRPRASS